MIYNKKNDLIVSIFPKNYEEMNYLEPFINNDIVLFNKNPKIGEFDETINDKNTEITNILKSLRKNPKEFIQNIKKYKPTEKTFNNLIGTEYEPAKELFLHIMSKNGLKTSYCKQNIKKLSKIIKNNLPFISERIKNVFILNKSVIEIINYWNSKNTLLYYNPTNDISDKDRIKLSKIINYFRGKVIVNDIEHKNLYKGWKKSGDLFKNF